MCVWMWGAWRSQVCTRLVAFISPSLSSLWPSTSLNITQGIHYFNATWTYDDNSSIKIRCFLILKIHTRQLLDTIVYWFYPANRYLISSYQKNGTKKFIPVFRVREGKYISFCSFLKKIFENSYCFIYLIIYFI